MDFRESFFDLMNSSREELFYNCRIKSKRLPDGSLEPYEVLYCDRFIFNPSGARVSELSRNIQKRLDYRAAAAELFGGELPSGGGYVSEKSSAAENAARSIRRAKGQLMDLIMVNDFDCFVTLTLDAEKINRFDYSAVIKKLNSFLDNRVRRSGLMYVGVPERHKSGALHFHFLCNASSLRLVDSDTVSCKGHKKPLKVSTADRYGIPAEDRQTVYNVADWSLGFSTAVMTYGDKGAVANYVGKYLTKQLRGDSVPQKIGGRWYYSGGKLERPVYTYQKVSFADVDNFSYCFECSGGNFKVWRF